MLVQVLPVRELAVHQRREHAVARVEAQRDMRSRAFANLRVNVGFQGLEARGDIEHDAGPLDFDGGDARGIEAPDAIAQRERTLDSGQVVRARWVALGVERARVPLLPEAGEQFVFIDHFGNGGEVAGRMLDHVQVADQTRLCQRGGDDAPHRGQAVAQDLAVRHPPRVAAFHRQKARMTDGALRLRLIQAEQPAGNERRLHLVIGQRVAHIGATLDGPRRSGIDLVADHDGRDQFATGNACRLARSKCRRHDGGPGVADDDPVVEVNDLGDCGVVEGCCGCRQALAGAEERGRATRTED